MDPVNVPVKSEPKTSIAIISGTGKYTDFKFGQYSQCPSEQGRIGVGNGIPSERALVSSYRPSIVTFPLSLRISEILPLLGSSTPLFPTHLPKISHVPLGVGGWPFGSRRGKVLR